MTILALTASMSSQWSTSSASKCIDGVNTYSVPCSGLCDVFLCHTQFNPQEWLVITVTGYNVDKVLVYNRIDGSEYWAASRINNAKFIISYDFAGTSIIYQSSFGTTASSVYTFQFSTCIAGKYSSTAGSSSCTSCDTGKYLSTPGATSASSCASCAVGTYSSTPGSSSCTSCVVGYTTLSTGAIASSQCSICAQGYYTNSATCTACQQGYTTNSTGATSISQCGIIIIIIIS